MGEATVPDDPGLRPPEGQPGPGEQPPASPPAAPPEGGQAGGRGGEEGTPDDRGVEWKRGFTEGTQKYADDLKEKALEADRLRAEVESLRSRGEPGGGEAFPDELNQEMFSRAVRTLPEFKQLRGSLAQSTVETTLARLRGDHGGREYFDEVSGMVRSQLAGTEMLTPQGVEAVFHHYAAPHVSRALAKAEQEATSLRKAQKDALAKDGYSTPAARAAGGEAPPADWSEASLEELEKARDTWLAQQMRSEPPPA